MKKLIIILLTTTLISCSGLSGGPGEIKLCSIKMYLSDNCEGDTVIGTIYTGEDLTRLEVRMAERELGECVELNVNGRFSVKTPNNPDLQIAYISIDEQKSWIVSNDCCYGYACDD